MATKRCARIAENEGPARLKLLPSSLDHLLKEYTSPGAVRPTVLHEGHNVSSEQQFKRLKTHCDLKVCTEAQQPVNVSPATVMAPTTIEWAPAASWSLKLHIAPAPGFKLAATTLQLQTVCPNPLDTVARLPLELHISPEKAYHRPFWYKLQQLSSSSSCRTFDFGTTEEGRVQKLWYDAKMVFTAECGHGLTLFLFVQRSVSAYLVCGVLGPDELLSRAAEEDYIRMLSQRKLPLVLDMDNTLMVAKKAPEAELSEAQQRGGTRRVTLSDGLKYDIKPRRGVEQFLRDCNQFFDLHICTAGTPDYAKTVCKALGWTQLLSQHRVCSVSWTRGLLSELNLPRGRGASGSKDLKYLCTFGLSKFCYRVFCVVDDRTDVWPDRDQRKYVHQIDMYNGSSQGGTLSAMYAQLKEIYDLFFDVFERRLRTHDDEARVHNAKAMVNSASCAQRQGHRQQSWCTRECWEMAKDRLAKQALRDRTSRVVDTFESCPHSPGGR